MSQISSVTATDIITAINTYNQNLVKQAKDEHYLFFPTLLDGNPDTFWNADPVPLPGTPEARHYANDLGVEAPRWPVWVVFSVGDQYFKTEGIRGPNPDIIFWNVNTTHEVAIHVEEVLHVLITPIMKKEED
jgi:hypothetical protein